MANLFHLIVWLWMSRSWAVGEWWQHCQHCQHCHHYMEGTELVFIPLGIVHVSEKPSSSIIFLHFPCAAISFIVVCATATLEGWAAWQRSDSVRHILRQFSQWLSFFWKISEKFAFFSLQNPSSDIRSGRPKPLRWLQKRFSATYFATILANAFLFSVFREKRFPFFKPRFLILEVVAPKNPQAETVNLDLLISFFSNGKLGRLVFHGNFVSFVAELLTRSTLNCSEEEEAAIIFKLGFVWDNRK